MEGRKTKKLSERLESIQAEREQLQEQLQGSNVAKIPMTLKNAMEATQIVLDNLTDVRSLVLFVDSLMIVGQDKIKVKLFGRTKSFDLN